MKESVHFIGIGGSGLSAIASVLLERGVSVSGSDRVASPVLKQLEHAGARIFIGHRPENVAGASLVIRSSAVPDDNVEVQSARSAGVRVIRREEYLGILTAGQQTIAVAGTHGKTTTTALIAWLLHALQEDPSYVIGGTSINLAGNAHAGQGKYFVIEADEYDHAFLGLTPWLAVVTNVEHDHPDCYPTFQDFYRAFESFVDRIQAGGALIACADDPGAAALSSRAKNRGLRFIPYGLNVADKGYRAVSLEKNESGGFRFGLQRNGVTVADSVNLNVPGVHNVANAVAALSVIDLLGLPLDAAARLCSDFRGVARRFEVRGEAQGITVIDDYAHHPTEISATLAAARARFEGRRIWAVWQPHTYSRIRTLMNLYLSAFRDADVIVVTEVYAARESAPEDGFSGSQIALELKRSLRDGSKAVYFQPELEGVSEFLLARLEPDDVLLVLSAGDADRISAQVLESLHRTSAVGLQGDQISGWRKDVGSQEG